MQRRRGYRAVLTLVLASILASAGIARATNVSFTGTFTQDDDLQLFAFVVTAQSNVTLRTHSFAGGTNAAGMLLPPGGFDPILALFDSTGMLLSFNDDGTFPNVSYDPTTYPNTAYDSFLQA